MTVFVPPLSAYVGGYIMVALFATMAVAFLMRVYFRIKKQPGHMKITQLIIASTLISLIVQFIFMGDGPYADSPLFAYLLMPLMVLIPGIAYAIYAFKKIKKRVA